MSGPGIPYLQPPATIVNEALDLLGESKKVIGDVTDGSDIAEAARRNYGQLLRNLLRTAHWDFARKRAKLTLLGDASGNSLPDITNIVECPWQFAYAWPIDGVQGRWLPWNPTNAQPVSSTGVPLTTGVSALTQYPLTPGRFLVSSSDQYPIEVGNVPWNQLPDLQRTFGVGPTNRKIILTDCCEAWFVYTRFVPVIEEWDSLFRQALVSLMAVALAPVAIEDRRLAVSERDKQIMIARNAIADARVANGNEAGMPQSTDFEASFIRARNWGGFWGSLSGFGNAGFGGAGGGGYFSGWDSFSFGGSVF
jgi:hypothetical protein